MNFNQLRIFYSVAKNSSVTLAAKELFLTQPAVSIQIHLLEEDYSVKLFNRSGKGITITEEGKLLDDNINTVFYKARWVIPFKKQDIIAVFVFDEPPGISRNIHALYALLRHVHRKVHDTNRACNLHITALDYPQLDVINRLRAYIHCQRSRQQ